MNPLAPADHLTAMSLSMTELLVRDADIPADVRDALAEGRPDDAGRRLMEQYGLSYEEVVLLIAPAGCLC